MSSEIKDISPIKKEDEENENNNTDINKFSRNFNKCLQKLKNQENNNKNNNVSEKMDNNNNINNNLDNTSSKNNNSLLNSLKEFDLIKNIPKIQNTKNDLKQKTKYKKSPIKTNNSNLILSSSSRDNLISSVVQTTSVQSGQIQNLKNKYLNSLKKNPQKLTKSKTMQNLKKCSFSQPKFESFLERVKEKQKNKEFHINNIRCKSLENEICEMNIHPEVNKRSLLLLKKRNRKPLYQQKPLNEEKNLDKNFQNFYEKSLKENQTNTYSIKNLKYKNNKNNIEEKYNKFYEDKMKWKKNVEQKNKNRKLNIEQEYQEFIDNFPFKPYINKKSINIVNKLNRKKSIDNNCTNNFYENGNDRETLDKFKTKLKPIINDYYNNKNNNPKFGKKNKTFRRTLSETYFNQIINLDDAINNNKMKNIKNKNKNKYKPKINYKINEKKYLISKNNDKNKNCELINNLKTSEKEYCLMKQIEVINKQKKIKNEGEDLYKLNVRPGGAWNKEVVNKITLLRQCDHIVENLL